jgi:hypothetical protein
MVCTHAAVAPSTTLDATLHSNDLREPLLRAVSAAVLWQEPTRTQSARQTKTALLKLKLPDCLRSAYWIDRRL